MSLVGVEVTNSGKAEEEKKEAMPCHSDEDIVDYPLTKGNKQRPHWDSATQYWARNLILHHLRP